MIRPAEIQKKANKERVRDTQIEKDYILTWILSGVANNEDTIERSKIVRFEDFAYKEAMHCF